MRLLTVPAGLRPWLPLVAGVAVAALLVGVGIGRILPDPGSSSAPSDASQDPSAAPDGHAHGGGGDEEPASGAADVGGVSLSQSGYTLVPETTGAKSGEKDWNFRIVDNDGATVTDFVTVHDKPMHLFAVRRDLTGYQHRHPDIDDDGQWSAPLSFDDPGPWRVIADFSVDTDKGPVAVTLGVDVTVDGDYSPETLPEPADRANAGDGLTVDVDFTAEIGVSAPALLSVTRDGEPIEPQSYLGARGHLVLLREGDVGFSHVHPDDELVDGAQRFWVTAPSSGTYRAFFDFKVDDEVRRVEFTVEVESPQG